MKLILSPHIDDDVIGCGGILDNHFFVGYFGVDDFHVVSAAERIQEATGATAIAGHHFRDPREAYKVNHYHENFTELVKDIEGLNEALTPDTVYIPWPSYNQDHQAVYNAAMIALRPHDKNWFVNKILLYEEPDCFWPGIGEVFKPNYFRKIDIDKKLSLYAAMPSQIRGHRSPEAIKALAAVRGAAIMEDYAEAYHILRWVD
jgi:N-acetylglucosamine malate deacetylase 1